LEPKGFGNIEPNTILKCLMAVKFGSIKKDQILALRDIPEEEMDALVKRTGLWQNESLVNLQEAKGELSERTCTQRTGGYVSPQA
jgi:hypothetical protein